MEVRQALHARWGVAETEGSELVSGDRWIFGCETHRPTVYADGDRSVSDPNDLVRLYEARERLLGLDSDFWPDEYRSQLWWLQGHRDCQVALFEIEHEPGERIELANPIILAATIGYMIPTEGLRVAVFAREDGTVGRQAEAGGEGSNEPPELVPEPADAHEERFHRGIVWLGEAQLLQAVGAADQGFQVRSVFADPARGAVGIVVTHPRLPAVEEFGEPTPLKARWDWPPVHMHVLEGGRRVECCSPAKLLIEQIGASS